MPMLLMFEAASEGDEEKTEAYASVFVEHAGKLVEVIIAGTIIVIVVIKLSIFLIGGLLNKSNHVIVMTSS